jgi:hypothetical protein
LRPARLSTEYSPILVPPKRRHRCQFSLATGAGAEVQELGNSAVDAKEASG